MELTINGRTESHPDGISVETLLERMQLAGKPCAVEVNKSIVPKRQHAEHKLGDGDTVEIVTLVGGG